MTPVVVVPLARAERWARAAAESPDDTATRAAFAALLAEYDRRGNELIRLHNGLEVLAQAWERSGAPVRKWCAEDLRKVTADPPTDPVAIATRAMFGDGNWSAEAAAAVSALQAAGYIAKTPAAFPTDGMDRPPARKRTC